uniref:Uncharacterized protein n=1 Tax=Janibacter limosus TaxID=53458 RepID=A0AC61U3C7_9MICO|nr:hypothetical protein [Janibacter limosus]
MRSAIERASARVSTSAEAVSRRPTSMTRSVATDMIPRPPTRIIPRMTSSPKVDQWPPVSTVTSPVTQVAEVAVKSAVSGSVASRDCEAKGVISTSVPSRMVLANLSMTVRDGFATRRLRRCALAES